MSVGIGGTESHEVQGLTSRNTVHHKGKKQKKSKEQVLPVTQGSGMNQNELSQIKSNSF